MDKCKTCKHYHFYQMLQGVYSYQGYIPCLSCQEWNKPQDNYEPVTKPKVLEVGEGIEELLEKAKRIRRSVEHYKLPPLAWDEANDIIKYFEGIATNQGGEINANPRDEEGDNHGSLRD